MGSNISIPLRRSGSLEEKTMGTVYQAPTDGEVWAYFYTEIGSENTQGLLGYAEEGDPTPSEVVCHSQCDRPYGKPSITYKVKKNWYWLVGAWPINSPDIKVFWLPEIP